MSDIIIVEATKNVDNGICFADVGQELVAQPFALGSALDESGDVHDFHRRRDDALRVNQFREPVEPFVGYGDNAHVRFDGAEREVGRLSLSVRKAVEKSGFSHVGKAYDATLKSHID